MGLTASYETPQITQAEVQKKCAHSILVRTSGVGSRDQVGGLLLGKRTVKLNKSVRKGARQSGSHPAVRAEGREPV